MPQLKTQPILVTKRLTLRAIEGKDEEDMLDLLTNTEVGKTYMLPEFAQREDARPLFEKLKDLSADNGRFVYGICLNGKLIGMLNDVEIDGVRVELGYVIHPAYQNQGYATEALTAGIDSLFQAGISTVETVAFEENSASMRVMEKSGMHRIPRTDQIDYRGNTHTCVYYQKNAKNR